MFSPCVASVVSDPTPRGAGRDAPPTFHAAVIRLFVQALGRCRYCAGRFERCRACRDALDELAAHGV
jgi:hypothetical protein